MSSAEWVHSLRRTCGHCTTERRTGTGRGKHYGRSRELTGRVVMFGADMSTCSCVRVVALSRILRASDGENVSVFSLICREMLYMYLFSSTTMLPKCCKDFLSSDCGVSLIGIAVQSDQTNQRYLQLMCQAFKLTTYPGKSSESDVRT